MRCPTCEHSGNPGYIVWPPGGGDGCTRYYGPCPDCGGSAVAHCCDGLREQPQAQPGDTDAG